MEEPPDIHSEEEAAANLLSVTKKNSESDINGTLKDKFNDNNVTLPALDVHSEEKQTNNNVFNNKKKSTKSTIIESDSEPDINGTLEDNEHSVNKLSIQEENESSDDEDIQRNKSNRNAKYKINSDESEDEITTHNKSFSDEKTAEEIIYTTNQNGELVPENAANRPVQKSLSSLCDADTSEDEDSEKNENIIDETVIQPKVYKPQKKRNKSEKGQTMTAQEAAKQRTEIQAESQRMIRESNVSLPYHKPKTYTIKEFLQKRAKLASALPLIPKAPPSLAIKMTKDKLEEISKTVDERIKQVEEFYKSESEDEEKDEREIVIEEIRGWVDALVVNAMDSVEKPMETEITDENGEFKESQASEESMEYEFNLDDINEEKSSKRSDLTKLIKENLLNVQPKLSGSPDEVIDLETGVTKPNEVKKLVEKYFQHAIKKVSYKHKVELDVIGIGRRGEIVKETVSMNVDEEEEPILVETPGAKLQKLREELQNQMAQRRSELWKQKQEQGDILTTEKKIESEPYDGEKDILDDEEEMELTETEDEEEEEDDLKPENPQPKSVFIEDEADEDEDEIDTAPNDDEEIADNEEQEDESDGFDGDDEDLPENSTTKKKCLKRIIKPFTEDSDEEDDEPYNIAIKPFNKSNLDSTASAEEEIIPPNQPRLEKTPQRPCSDNNKSEFDFLTPVTYLTGLQNLSSDLRFLKESPIISPFRMLFGTSPLKETKAAQKNLFSSDTTQDNVDDLANICSGEFPETQDGLISQEKVSENVPSTQELLNICSGDFIDEKTQDEMSEKIVINIKSNADKEIKSLDDDQGLIISQLLDEAELERFKKKFESPLITASQEETDEVNATGLINSDNENEELEVKRKKSQKKLVFSDDEDTSEQDEEEFNQENEDKIDLHDTDDEEQILENEMKARDSTNFKLTDFFEDEAELSESDWGSADEDEKGLDEFEFEEADKETINENKVRTELERIHMRQMLDKDNREVKILQELLLEDGEMHGAGRQRQFRWRALDAADNSEFEKREDDDIFLDEEENEEQFRKMRHKRDTFLKKKSESDDVISILSNSQILNINTKVIIKNTQSFSSQEVSTSSEVPEPEEINEPLSLLSKRGSFLKRNDQVLQRLTEYNKVTENVIGNIAKNSRNFVFQTVETTESATIIKNNNNKRKAAAETTARVVKKPRLNVVNKKQPEKGKLFGNW